MSLLRQFWEGGPRRDPNSIAYAVLLVAALIFPLLAQVATGGNSSFILSVAADAGVYILLAIGLNVVEVLVLPRMIGLIITLPILTLWADLMGLFGGFIMVWAELGVPLSTFLRELYGAVDGGYGLLLVARAVELAHPHAPEPKLRYDEPFVTQISLIH